MDIIVAETAGFCFGVDRAVNLLYDHIRTDKKIYTLGPIIHNPQVVEDLRQRGVQVLDELEGFTDSDAVVVIRTHGVAKSQEEYLKQHGVSMIDATCPYVKKIHRIVQEHYEAGETIVIVGDANHPEVMGINGWCNNEAIIIDNPAEIPFEKLQDKKLCIVSQTTLIRSLWDEVLEQLKPFPSTIFDTICSATQKRQNEAEEIAAQSDVMIVVGGTNSSNTKKLVQVCRKHCPTYHVENAEQLTGSFQNKKIGITAGASTPAHIIKEVVEKMAEENTMTQAEFADELEKTFKTLNTGDVVRGTVIGMTPTEVYVDLGTKADGFIPVSELTDNPDVKPEELIHVGDEVEVFVVRVNDVEGTIQLSQKKVASIKGWEIIQKAMDEQRDLSGKVIEIVNGGMIMLVEGMRVFVPASLASDRFMRDLTPLMGKELPLRLIDINQRRRKVVGSVKAILQEQKAVLSKELWDGIEEGKRYKGVVKSLTPFGAFVDIGGVDGLIHISELSWRRIKHPSEVVQVGDEIDTFVLSFDKETGKISLGYRNPDDNPWEKVKNLEAGQVVSCKVVRLVPFGAFVEIVPEVDGLVHISQIADKRIGKPADVLEIGQQVDAKILEIDLEKKKISLSIRALLEKEEPVVEEQPAEAPAQESEVVYTEEMNATIGDVVEQTEE